MNGIVKFSFKNLILIFFISVLLLNYFFKEKYLFPLSINSFFHYIFFFVFIILLLINFKIIENYLIFIFSLYLCLLVLNFCVKILYYGNDKFSFIKQYEKQTGSKIRTSIYPRNFLESRYQIMPLSNLSHTNIVYCNEAGYWSTYKSDRYGFNNDDDVYEKKNKIILVGGSDVQGACVNEGEDIASRLREKDFNVVGLGMGGNDEILKYATIKEYFTVINPKIIIWIFSYGDLQGAINELKSEKLLKYFNDQNFSQNLALKNKDKDIFLNQYISKIENKILMEKRLGYISLYDLRRVIKKIIIEKFRISIDEEVVLDSDINNSELKTRYDNIYSDKNFKLIEKNFYNVKKICIEDCKILFVFTPSHKDFIKNKFSINNRINLFRILRNMDIDVLDLTDEVNLLDIDKFMIGHFNREGYEFISDKIVDRLRNYD